MIRKVKNNLLTGAVHFLNLLPAVSFFAHAGKWASMAGASPATTNHGRLRPSQVSSGRAGPCHVYLQKYELRPSLTSLFIFCLLLLIILLSACGNQAQQPDPRLKYFVILDSRVLIEGNNAEVIGDVENTGKMKFPFDVTMQANLMDINGQTIGTAIGTAEDVGLGQVRQFVLTGTVDGTRYAKLKVMPVSLQEKRQELNLPTPTPIGP